MLYHSYCNTCGHCWLDEGELFCPECDSADIERSDALYNDEDVF